VPNEVITITEDEIVATMSTLKVNTGRTVPNIEEAPKQEEVQVEIEALNVNEENSTEKESTEVAVEIETPSLNAQNSTFNTNAATLFDDLVKKIYDRNFDLGECFKRNIEFESFEDSKLTWGSTAEGEDKKQLITHWGVINMFVKEIFGLETKIVNVTKKKIDIDRDPPHQDADAGSMIEDIEMKSSCIAPEAGETEAAKEKDPSTLLNEPMIKEAIALFDPKKVRIKRNA
jgi:DNA polymerase-3 subunit gamma/tau